MAKEIALARLVACVEAPPLLRALLARAHADVPTPSETRQLLKAATLPEGWASQPARPRGAMLSSEGRGHHAPRPPSTAAGHGGDVRALFAPTSRMPGAARTLSGVRNFRRLPWCGRR